MTKKIIITILFLALAGVFSNSAKADHFAGVDKPCEELNDTANLCNRNRNVDVYVCTDGSYGRRWINIAYDIECPEGYECVSGDELGHSSCEPKTGAKVDQQEKSQSIFEKIQQTTLGIFTSPDTNKTIERNPIILQLNSADGTVADDTSKTSFDQNETDNNRIVIELEPRMAADGWEEIVIKLKRVDQDDMQEASACGDSMKPVPENAGVWGGAISGSQLDLMIKWGKIMFNAFNQAILGSLKDFSNAVACYNSETWQMALVNSETGETVATNEQIRSELAKAAKEAEEQEEEEIADSAITIPLIIALSKIQSPIILPLQLVEELAKRLQAKPITITEPVLFESQSVEIEIPKEKDLFSVKQISGNVFRSAWNCVKGICKILGLPTGEIIVSGEGSLEQSQSAGNYKVSMRDQSGNTVATYIVNVYSDGAAPTTKEVVTPVITSPSAGAPQTETEAIPAR